jgi:hypothetical protein
MRDAYILGAKVGEQMFISSRWFPTDLERHALAENIVRSWGRFTKLYATSG